MIKTIELENDQSSKLSFGSLLYQKASRSLLKIIPFMPSHDSYNITICHEKKFLWFRVAKVGTRTIFDVFKNANLFLDAEHPMSCHYPPFLFKDYFKFAFVRNPWDRIVSCWKNKVVDNNYFDFSESQLAEMQEFSCFIDHISNMDIELCDHHIRLQSKLIDLNNIDYIGKFEKFEEHLLEVMQILEIESTKISHRNASSKVNITGYRDHYDNETKQKVHKIYERDINIFSYEY